MTEREAWLHIADRLAEAIANRSEDFIITSKHGNMFPCDGLCDSVAAIRISAYIDTSIAASMRLKIQTHAPKHGSRYAWPLGDFVSRVAFCRKMADLCEKGECDGK